MRFLYYLARPDKNMIDMITVSCVVWMICEYGLQIWWKALIIIFLLSWISIRMEKFCGFR